MVLGASYPRAEDNKGSHLDSGGWCSGLGFRRPFPQVNDSIVHDLFAPGRIFGHTKPDGLTLDLSPSQTHLHTYLLRPPLLLPSLHSQSGESCLLPMGSSNAQTSEPRTHHAHNVSGDSHLAHGSAAQGVFLLDPCNGVSPLEGHIGCAGTSLSHTLDMYIFFFI